MLKQGRICTEDYCIIPVRIDIKDRVVFLNDLRKTGEQHAVTIVCLNAKMIAGFHHAETALIHALRSWREDRRIARSLEMEVLLYAAGTRQTGQIGPFGPEPGIHRYFLCITPPHDQAVLTMLSLYKEVTDEDWNIISEDKKARLISFYGITPQEIEVTGEDHISDLVRERSALLTVNR